MEGHQNILRELDLNLGYHFSEKLRLLLAKPYWVFISLTHKCNFNCQMCGVKKILKDYDLDFSTLKRTIDEVAEWKSDCVVVLTGGETFLRKDIFEIIGYCVDAGVKTEIVSNGSQINNAEIARKIINSGLKNMAISLDGANEQTHDRIRGYSGAYKSALKAIELLVSEKKIRKSGPQISVWTTMMKENVQELYDIIPLTKNLGVECLVYHPVIVTQDDMQNTINDGKFWIKEGELGILKQNIDRIVEYQKKNGYVAFLHDPYLWMQYFRGTLKTEDWKCNPFVFIDIGPDGFVRSCGQAFGNVNEISLYECLSTKDARNARDRMLRCAKPCLQTCWARPEASSLKGIVNNFICQVDSLFASTDKKKELIENGLHLLAKYENAAKRYNKNESQTE